MRFILFMKNDPGLAKKLWTATTGRKIVGLGRGTKDYFADPAFSGVYKRNMGALSGEVNSDMLLSRQKPSKPFLGDKEQNKVMSKFLPRKSFSTSNRISSKETESKVEGDKDSDKPLTQRQKLARIFAAYGTTAVVFHTSISLTSLGICYMIVSSGIDMVAIMQKIGIASEDGLQSTFTAGASTFVIAYACHKVFMPVRIFLTITCTPVIVGKLRSLGILKDKTVKEKA